ncbi:MAG: DUF1292 domain-containing protein [Bacilli bacterium]|nr:DUF1292 domain-containing protein [Bacilli bacterium]
MLDKQITIIDDNGNEVVMEILLTFHLDQFNKDYVAYFNPLLEEMEVYVDSYDDNNNLYAVESDEEWDMIDEVIGAFIEDDE